MNKIGIYYAYWTHDWDADFHPFVDKVAGLGFDILEVNGGTIGSMNTAERKSLKAHADDKGLILTYCIGLPRQYDIASEYQSVRADGIGYLKQVASAIGEMGVTVFDRIEQAIEWADALNVLRLQLERMHAGYIPSLREYNRVFGVTRERLARAPRDVLILHPGPMNRGVEIDSDVADGPHSVILDQVTNGVAIRMAVLYLLAGHTPALADAAKGPA